VRYTLSSNLIHRLYARAFERFRPRRLRDFYHALELRAGDRVADIGGTPYFWELAAQLGLPPLNVTICNLIAPEEALPANVRWVRADALRLPFADASFDAVFSNSLIEHLGTAEAQRRAAEEIARLAPRYFVETPSPRFPIEQHMVTPFLHWLPRKVQRRLMRPLSLAGTSGRLSREQFEQFLDDLLLLDRRALAALFPDAEIRSERFCGLEKSLLAVRGRRPRN
jgi:hypothetical protein